MTTATNVLWRRLAYVLTPQVDMYRHLASRLAGKRVLEVGFGTGFGTLQYAHDAVVVDAIEVDADAVDFARMAFPGVPVNWICADFLEYRPTITYDAIVMVEVLEHMHDAKAALVRASELLDMGGCLYLTARNAHADLRKNDLHEMEWTAAELREHLLVHFDEVWLYDYTLRVLQDEETRLTPLVAIATGGKHGEAADFTR